LDYEQRLRGLHWLTKTSYQVFCALVFAAIALWAWRYASRERLGISAQIQRPAFVRAATMFALALMLLFSPHYAWYIAWLVPLMVFYPNWMTLTYVCAFFYGFTTQWAMPGPKMFLLNQWIYFAVLCALVAEIAWEHWSLRKWFDCRGAAHAQ
jgi:hypothetical protein